MGLLPQEADFLIRFNPDRVLVMLDVVDEHRRDDKDNVYEGHAPSPALDRLDALDRSNE